MCGITGVFSTRDLNHQYEIGRLTESVNLIMHRGKDSIVVNDYSSCVIRFNRLAITNLSENQPAGKNWIVYLNGEIYNYQELGYTGSECEVISKGFEENGPDFVKKLNGMFVIIAINGDDVWIFRDRYGIKPLYYSTRQDGAIVFSSEIKPILGEKPTINPEVEEQWLTFNNVLTCDTLFNGVKKLKKGTYWHLNSDTQVKYWEWSYTPTPIDYSAACNTIHDLVIQAIHRQCPSEVKYGSCLSGGIDSNIIYRVLGLDTQTYTAAFPMGVDESKLLELKPNNKVLTFTNIKFFDETIYHLEDLRVGASWSNYGLYQLASNDVKVLFDGAGADELFGGYGWRYTSPNYYEVVNRTNRESEYSESLFNSVFTEDTLENRFKFDANYFLEGVLTVCDRLSMAHTIELRVPFLDNDLVDFCLTLPNEYKKDKMLLRDAFKYLLPENILNAKKQGFSSPDLFEGEGNQASKWSNAALKKWKEFYDNGNL
jgi:asparagine synthase (glutamine-hydrolysing)